MTSTKKKARVLEPALGAPKRCSSVLSAARVAVFLENLTQYANVSEAAYAAGLDRIALHRQRKIDPALAEAWEEAYNLGIDKMEEEGQRRATQGVRKNIYYKGRVVGSERQYSDVLMMFFLKGAKPEKFRERSEVTGKGGGPIAFVIEGKD